MALLLAAALVLTACGAPKEAQSSPGDVAAQPENTQAVPAATAPEGVVPGEASQAPAAEVLQQIVQTGGAPTVNPFEKSVYDGPPSAMRPEAAHFRDIGPLEMGKVIHWDLSRLSSTMAYAQLYTMLTEPEQFVGQTVKVQGQYYSSPAEDGVPQYHFVIVFDAAACCELGVEFLWTGNHPASDYPALMSIVEMTGLFDICNDGGERFCVIRIDDLKVVQEAPPPSITVMP